MKKILHLILLCFFAGAFTSCSKDHDLSELKGEWKSTAMTLHLTPEDPDIHAALQKEIDSRLDYWIYRFEDNNRFGEYQYKNEAQLAMTAGTYFHNNGYKVRFEVTGFFGHKAIDLAFETEDKLTARFDATKRLGDPVFLDEIGAPVSKNHPVEKVEITLTFSRTSSSAVNP